MASSSNSLLPPLPLWHGNMAEVIRLNAASKRDRKTNPSFWKCEKAKRSEEFYFWAARAIWKTLAQSNFCPKIQFWQNPNIFTSFSPNFFFWQFFSWNQSCQQLKSPKPQHFHEFLTQKIDNFLGKSKLNFWTKNEDFEQCGFFKSKILHFFWLFHIFRSSD